MLQRPVVRVVLRQLLLQVIQLPLRQPPPSYLVTVFALLEFHLHEQAVTDGAAPRERGAVRKPASPAVHVI